MVEKARYELLKKFGDLELRRYPQLLLAVVHDTDDDPAFGILFRYITGENTTQQKIKMTAPVITDDTGSEKIPMTAPVINRGNSMAFVMPETYTQNSLPQPKDPRVSIEVQGARQVAVRRFSGRARPEQAEEQVQKLVAACKSHGLATKGPPFLMRYNSPFMPGPFRRNEVAVEIIEPGD